MNPVKSVCLAVLALILSSCAASYKPIFPESLRYNQAYEAEQGLTLGYRYNILGSSLNRKYAKKEMKKGLQLVAVEISNHGKKAVTIGKDALLYANSMPLHIIDYHRLHDQLKQTVPTYLLYMLLTPLQFNTSSQSGETHSTPIGLAIGPGITILNIAKASSANARLRDQLVKYDITGKEIAPGETIYGIIGVYDLGSAPIGIRKVKLESDSDSFFREE